MSKYELLKFVFRHSGLLDKRDKFFKFNACPFITCHWILNGNGSMEFVNSRTAKFSEFMKEADMTNTLLNQTVRDTWNYYPNADEIKNGVKHLREMIHYNRESMKWADACNDRKEFWHKSTVYYDANLIPLTENAAVSKNAHTRIAIILHPNLFNISDDQFNFV